jgi:drug/metabolite transporter (DMT)-like permease
MALIIASFASLIFGVADFAGGYASRTTPVRQVVLYSQAVGLLCVAVTAPLMGAEHVRMTDLGWGALAGLSGMVALLMFYDGLARGKVSVVSPLAAIAGIALPVVFGSVIGERPGVAAIFGIALAFPAVWLISRAADTGPSELWRGGVVQGLISGCGFGGFFILISRASDASGMWPLVSARTTTVVTMIAILLASRRLSIPDRSQWWIIAVSGVADVTANILFVVAVRSSLLILTSVIISLYPVSTLILARVVLGERTAVLQRIGLAIGVVAVVAITLG